MPGPLAGIRILELGSNLSAPVATMFLGDQGADVIKIETQTGDQLRYGGNRRRGVQGLGTMFLNANRNKRSIVLDLKAESDLQLALDIAAACDVVIQNFRPGIADRIGLGYDTVRALRSDTIYVSIDGFGETGPAVGRRAYDIVIQGIAGYAGAQAGGRSGEPMTMRTTVVDKTTALFAAQAISAALLARERTGIGQHIRISMLDVALSFIWPEIMSESTLIGENVESGGNLSAVRYCFRTADGHIMVGYVSNDEFAGLCGVLDREDLVRDSRFDSIGKRFANSAVLNDLIADSLQTRPTAYWLTRLEAADGIYAPVNWPETVVDDPLIAARHIITEHDHPHVGPYRQPVHPVRFSQTPATLRRHAPALNEHHEEIRSSFSRAEWKST